MKLAPLVGDDLMGSRPPLRAYLLVLLHDRPGHGYGLLKRLEPFGFDRSNPGRIYRALRWLDDVGLVEPGWEVSGGGPARRIYALSPEGQHALEVTAPALRRLVNELDDPVLARYLLARLRAVATNKQAFEFTLQVRCWVQASDEEVARRKLLRTLDKRRPIGTDVWVEAQGIPFGGRSKPTP